MNNRNILLALLVIAGFSGLAASEASAQATRTWVSGVGDDVNPCSRTAPCKTFAGAISKTAANGTINCIDPGGFGAVTITKSMTIDCESQGGGILAAATTGINVNGAGIVVKIRNLAIEGVNTGTQGVNILNGAAVLLDNVSITQFNGGNAAGIRVAIPNGVTTELVVTNSRISDCGLGGGTGGGAVFQPAAGATFRFAFDNVDILNNNIGVTATGSVRGTISNSLIQGHSNVGIFTSGATAARIFVDQTVLSGNVTGIAASGGTGIIVGRSTITANTNGLIIGAPATIQSFGNNQNFDNTANGAFSAPLVSQN